MALQTSVAAVAPAYWTMPEVVLGNLQIPVPFLGFFFIENLHQSNSNTFSNITWGGEVTPNL